MNGEPKTAAGLLVRDVVREIVSELAPHELLVLDGLLVVDDDTALRRLSSRGEREPLGFGVGEATALVTPVVWMALDEAARQVVSATVAAAGRRSREWLRRIGRRPAAPRVLPPLAPEQLEAVRLRVAQLAVESGLDAGAAEVLAERVVARLVLSAEQHQDGDAGPDGAALADTHPQGSDGPQEEDRR
ncbi:hypothetical protein [Streptomyces sp. NBC_00557]|uniref:hypothetical protein n=1 Tax=Streptomyces sp. NBC_00557 TaxID=2975776 RepID=UPI002E81EE10|nr:hypothetical protein [Streptomyces sp. NBC_00557]WUC39294.1 hypothetical protein OG956_36220 [Streptomyces sp. NBC_00557]